MTNSVNSLRQRAQNLTGIAGRFLDKNTCAMRSFEYVCGQASGQS